MRSWIVVTERRRSRSCASRCRRPSTTKGYRLGQLQRSEEELAAYEELDRRYGQAPEPGLQVQVAKALGNKGVRLGKLQRSEEAIAVYEELDRRYGQASELVLREQVARALNNKGYRLSKLQRSEEAIAVYAELDRRYGQAPERGLREQVARAHNGHGFRLLLNAKRDWLSTAQRPVLEKALELFRAALPSSEEKDFVLGNIGYAEFLCGRQAGAEAALREALLAGGEELYKAELADSEQFQVPPDPEFRELLTRIWQQIKSSREAAAG